MIDVSVCMITYNHSKYVRKAIRGVFNQESNLIIELLISDDFSTDGTDEIIQEELRNTPQGFIVNYIKRKKNVGVNENFINALYNCRGKYIAICEGDDYWDDNNKLAIQYEFLSNNKGFVMSFHDGFIVKENRVTGDMILNNSIKKNILIV